MKGREMEYRVRVWSALHGHVVPLLYVAEAMAKRAATGYGTLTLHGPTLENLRPERVRLLWDAAMSGQLTVCDSQGRIASATELVGTARASAAELAGDASVAPIDAENILPFLFTSHHHLIEWGKARGNVFLFVETPGTVVDSDLRNFTEAGYGEVIEPGYHRSFAGGGESEPWRDDLYVTAPGTTSQEQNTAAPVPPSGSDGPLKPRRNKTKKTLIFEEKVLALLSGCWNGRATGTKPNKTELCKQVYAEMLRGTIRGERGLTESMVRDAAKPWKFPLVLPAFVPDSKFNDKRHPFKDKR